MALTANRVKLNNKSNDREQYILEYYYLHTYTYTLLYSNDILESLINGRRLIKWGSGC